MSAFSRFTLTLALAAAEPAAPDSPQQTVVCIAHGPIWRATGADVRAIEAVPVPTHFMELERITVCSPMGGMIATLIGWHLAFGSERSTSAALTYFEDRHLGGLPADFPAALRRQSQAALRDLQRERTSAQPAETEPALWDIPSMVRLGELVRGLDALVYLAESELRGAEAFDSLPLLERAERHWVRASQAAPLLTAPTVSQAFARFLAQADEDEGDFHMFDEFEPFRLENLGTRIAILRAHLTRTAEDFARAESLVNAAERPDYRRLAESAGGASDTCAYDPGDANRDANASACDAQRDLRTRVASWAVNRALLDQIGGSDDERNANLALDLLYLGWLPERGGCCRWSARDDIVRLRLMLADRSRRRLEAETDREEIDGHWQGAVLELRNALESVRPSDEPARFRRIAEAWLRLWDWAQALPPDAERDRLTWRPEDQRYAVHLRRLLEDLPEIATAAR
ncbi:MAG TPA: hypothetical protein VD887_12340 [Allosphingosinicella sp.]|nr:hypothetical protein [Allosphingosinicella sp.]HYG30986.1 hypothetical protein [Allosphingosinicella sp.]